MLLVIHCSEGLVIQGVVLNVYPKYKAYEPCVKKQVVEMTINGSGIPVVLDDTGMLAVLTHLNH